jgi:hypothetical protein
MRAGRGRCPGWLPAALASLALFGCGGKGPSDSSGGTTTPPPVVPMFLCRDSQVAVDQVALKCATRLNPDVWQIAVVIGSPTTSTDIDGFAFDLLLDANEVQYVPDSALIGPMLTQGGNTPLLSATLKPGNPNRLVVGIARTGGAPGVQGIAGFDQIMLFSVKRVPGAQFDPDPRYVTFDKSASTALDSSASAQPIPSITFSDQLLLSNQ